MKSLLSGLSLFSAIILIGSPVKAGNLTYALSDHAPVAIGIAVMPSTAQYAFASESSVATLFAKNFSDEDQNFAVTKQLSPTVTFEPSFIVNQSAETAAFNLFFDDSTMLSCMRNWGFVTVPNVPPSKKAVSFLSNQGASAVLYDDGTIFCWGDPDHGGNAPFLNAPTKIVSIVATDTAFCALCDNGKVLTWGNSNNGGGPSGIPADKRVVSLVSNCTAVTALCDDGTIFCWGDTNDMSMPNISSEKKVVSIIASSHAFAALCDDKSVVSWGYSGCGGGLSGIPLDKKIVSLSASYAAFTALCNDGTIFSWGDTRWGGSAPSMPPGLKVILLAANNWAFSAVCENGSILAWGDPDFIGTLPIVPTGEKIVSLVANEYSFSVLCDDGNVLAWGEPSAGGSAPVIPAGKKVISIISSNSSFSAAFMALCDDQTVVAWGDSRIVDNMPTISSGAKITSLSSAYQKTTFYAKDALAGIAIVNNPISVDGTWQYAAHGSSNWIDIPSTISDTNAMTLRNDAMIRFVPNAGITAITSELDVRLIDVRSNVQNGEQVDVSVNGGSTPVSELTVPLMVSHIAQ